MQKNGEAVALDAEQQLFLSLAEQLARPLLQISHLAELSVTDDAEAARMHWQTVQHISRMSLHLAQSYALSLRVQGKVTPLKLEPITVSSLLYDTAQELQAFARQYEVSLELDPGPRMQPILADRTVLQSALVSLGQVFVQAQAESGSGDGSPVVRMCAHRSRYGIVAGMYGSNLEMGTDVLRRSHRLKGWAYEPLSRLVGGPAAGVFVADSLLHTLATRLHVARYRNLTGLATTLQPSRQLQLV